MKNTNTIEEQDGSVLVSKTLVNNLDKTEKTTRKEKRIRIRPFVTATATVGCKKGVTLNLDNYESVRFDVFISTPCYASEIVDVYNQVSKLSEELLTGEVNAFRAGDTEEDD